ncbi:hypothetical protein [Pseudomonas svalbardensis]|uniref:hypothetical protein n=1 Tax=Pseudomonas svalbardensis TaxID=3042029 RepID=UPI0024B3390C|nr:hypothetical protein [Pseudomonas sp. PMCC200367]
MLVSAKQNLVAPLPKRPGDEPITDAAAGLQGGLQAAMTQALQNNVQAQNAQTTKQVQDSATQIATQQVSEATRISDNVDEAFAKTRVALQASVPDDSKTKSTDSAAMTDFKDYMSKTPEQRLRDSILKELGITEDQLKAMPPEQQLAIGKEIAERIQDKMKMAQADKENGATEKANDTQVVDKFLASL